MPPRSSPLKSSRDESSGNPGLERLWIWGFPIVLVVLLVVLFGQGIMPGMVMFSNDGPLGGMIAEQNRAPGTLMGLWQNLNVLGTAAGALPPSLTGFLLCAVGPWFYAKLLPAAALLLLGICAWFCFRSLRLGPVAAALGGLAACLNSSFFSVACWGVASHTVTIAMCFLALGLLARGGGTRGWIRAALAGMAVGMGVMEGADVGVLFSLLTAGAVVYQSLVVEEGSPVMRTLSGFGRLSLVTVCALFLAAVAVYTQIQTAVVGVAGTQQDTQTKAQRWDFATQWSLPKLETLQFAVPGLFGYRMDTPDGGSYWGAVGRDPAWDRYFAAGAQGEPPPGYLRQTGGGIYTGLLVLLLAGWAMSQGFRGKESAFGPAQRKWVWFWTAVALASLLLAWGRFAPFYQVLYALPYVSTIRSPAKFTHFVNFALVFLFAYGVHALTQRYFQVALTTSLGPVEAVKAWWSRARSADRRWVGGCLLVLGGSAVVWLIYAASRKNLTDYLAQVQLGGDIANSIAGFSIRSAGLYVLLLAVAVGLLALVFSGWCAGRRANLGALLLGGFLLFDLGRANLPWLIYVDWEYKYASNPVIEFLRQKPYEQRVVGLPFQTPPQFGRLGELYRIEWAQHHFLFYNIQSLDIIQMPRMPEDLATYEIVWRTNGTPGLLRRWELTNTRYILGPAFYAEGLNSQVDPAKRRFSVKFPFDIVPKPEVQRVTQLEDFTAIPTTNGPYAVLEFAGVLPRAKLYSNWTVNTNDGAVLTRLFSPEFVPQQEVILDSPSAPPNPVNTNTPAGSVDFVSYAPKHVVLKADVKVPAVLLLNDRTNPGWTVTVDGRPAELLRANFLMRAVRLEPGAHQVEFHYHVSTKPLYISLSALAVALLLSVSLAFTPASSEEPAASRQPPNEQPK